MRISRRGFLKQSGTVVAVASFSRALPGPFLLGEPLGLPAGIQLFAVREPLMTDTPGTLKRLYEIGYREVEPAGFGKYTAEEFSVFVRDAGLHAPSAHMPFNGTTDLGRIFSDCHALGAQYATSSSLRQRSPNVPLKQPGQAVPSGNKAPQLPNLGSDGFKRMAARMNELGAAAKAAGMQYCYHNGSLEFERLPDGRFGYDLLLRESDPDLVFFEADCGWIVACGGDLEEYFKSYPKRFRLLHVKDFKPIAHPQASMIDGERPEGTEFGAGYLDHKAIFAAARSASIEHVFEEQEQPYTRPQLESAEISYRYLHSLK